MLTQSGLAPRSAFLWDHYLGNRLQLASSAFALNCEESSIGTLVRQEVTSISIARASIGSADIDR